MTPIRLRKHLHVDALFARIRAAFERILDARPGEVAISLADALMSAFAMFSLKDPSLLAFDQRRKHPQKLQNLTTIYQIDRVPCDTHMRALLDVVPPEALRPVYRDLFRQVQRGKVVSKLQFLDGYYLLSVDGTQYFSSTKVQCPCCLKTRASTTGDVRYSHQMLGAAIVHPDVKAVVPVCPEPIVTQDGSTKNDCERNAGLRFFRRFRKAHPHLPVIVIEDGLSANAPHIRALRAHNLRFMLGVKSGDHAFLFEQVEAAALAGRVVEHHDESGPIPWRYRFVNQVPLNQSNPDLLVNFLEYWEIQADGGLRHFAWVTDLAVTRENAYPLTRGGRARWKIENETFTTLKNQGYHYDHNFGHGHQHLSVIFALLMMLAFLVDQVQQLACRLFQAVWRSEESKARLWEHVRALFYSVEFESMTQLFQALLYGYRIERLVILYDSS